MKTSSIQITPELLALIAEIDEFKGAWRSLGTLAPECRVVRDRTEKPQDEHGAMPPAPVYPKCAYGHSATGPRVMNPAFHLADISRVAAAESGING